MRSLMHMHNEMLTTAQVAEALAVNPSSISRMVARGELAPQFKAPGVRGPMFFSPSEVERVIAARSAESVEAKS